VRTTSAAVALAGLLALTGCGTDQREAAVTPPGTGEANQATLVCAKDAKPISPPASLPTEATLPSDYVVTRTEARSAERTVLTAVSPKPFKETLADMQRSYSTRGWIPSEGEVEGTDAESNFSGHELRGRWAIRQIPGCPDNTSVSVLIGK
jgi:hypothetical protein